jgi:hypothetical protein
MGLLEFLGKTPMRTSGRRLEFLEGWKLDVDVEEVKETVCFLEF